MTSRGAMPVPPVVTTSRTPSPVAFSIARRDGVDLIGNDHDGIDLVAILPRAGRATAGPERSSRSPREAASEQVMTRAITRAILCAYDRASTT